MPQISTSPSDEVIDQGIGDSLRREVGEHVLLRPARAAEVLDVEIGALAQWRSQGTGPRYVKIGKSVSYLESDLVKFIREKRLTPTNNKKNARREPQRETLTVIAVPAQAAADKGPGASDGWDHPGWREAAEEYQRDRRARGSSPPTVTAAVETFLLRIGIHGLCAMYDGANMQLLQKLRADHPSELERICVELEEFGVTRARVRRILRGPAPDLPPLALKPDERPKVGNGNPVAASTIAAAKYLVTQNDPERLQQWLARHSAEERAAIRQHFAKDKR